MHPRLSMVIAGTIALMAMHSAGAQSGMAGDPFEPVNRKVYAFNDAVDRILLKPTALFYQRYIPGSWRRGVHNFFENAHYPVVFLNQFLQGKIRIGVQDTARFLVNTTAGIGGIFDVADNIGLPAHEEDFGQTLGRWQLPSGPYLVIPFLGPSSLRDGFGSVGDYYGNLPNHVEHIPTRNTLTVAAFIDERESLLAAERLLSGDRYLFLRDAFLQQREFLVRDGISAADPFLDE